VEGHLARVQLAMPGVLILLMSPRPVPKIRGAQAARSQVSSFPAIFRARDHDRCVVLLRTKEVLRVAAQETNVQALSGSPCGSRSIPTVMRRCSAVRGQATKIPGFRGFLFCQAL
jgi:hypothetical protein